MTYYTFDRIKFLLEGKLRATLLLTFPLKGMPLDRKRNLVLFNIYKYI